MDLLIVNGRAQIDRSAWTFKQFQTIKNGIVYHELRMQKKNNSKNLLTVFSYVVNANSW